MVTAGDPPPPSGSRRIRTRDDPGEGMLPPSGAVPPRGARASGHVHLLLVHRRRVSGTFVQPIQAYRPIPFGWGGDMEAGAVAGRVLPAGTAHQGPEPGSRFRYTDQGSPRSGRGPLVLSAPEGSLGNRARADGGEQGHGDDRRHDNETPVNAVEAHVTVSCPGGTLSGRCARPA